MRLGLRPDDGEISGSTSNGGINTRDHLRRELVFLIRDIAMKNEPERWQAAHTEAMAEVGATIKSGEHTINEWIKALA